MSVLQGHSRVETGGAEALRGRRPLGVLPAAVLATLAVTLLVAWGVGVADVGRYAAYLVVVVVLPGWVLWRVAGPALAHGAEELAVGAGVGYALETLARILASLLHVPPLVGVLAPPLLALGALLHPPLRARARRPWVAQPAAVSWAYAGVLGVGLVWFGYAYFARQPLAWSGAGGPENDLLFALGLAGEVTHRWPLEFPWVGGEPLLYHWFFAEHLASATELTGIPLPTLLLRLDLVPALVVVAVATGALAVRMSARAWSGPLAAGLLLVVQDAAPIPWRRLLAEPVADLTGAPFDVTFWWSTSGAYAAVVFAPLALLLVDAVRGRVARPTWLLLGLLLAVSAGAKASILPVVLVASGSVVLLTLWRERRWHRPALVLTGGTVVVFAVAWFVVYGGQPQGLQVIPLKHVLTTTIGSLVLGEGVPGRSVLVMVAALVLCVLATVVPFAGLALLAARSSLRRDPVVQACCGAAVLGLAAMVLLYHQGQSNLYFLRTALPLLTAAAAWAIGETASLVGSRSAILRWFVAPLCAGAALMVALVHHDWTRFRADESSAERLAQVGASFVLCAVGVGVAVAVARRSAPRGRRAAAAGALAGVAFLAGLGAVRVPVQTLGWAATRPLGWEARAANPMQRIDHDQVLAAQWIRDHSEADDLVVTNVFCSNGATTRVRTCDNRTFWVAAYTERRTVLSGWGYTPTANAGAARAGYTNGWQFPYWDQARLTGLRTFLAAPTEARARDLRADGARYVLVVPGFDAASPDLARWATPVHRNGAVMVYRLDA